MALWATGGGGQGKQSHRLPKGFPELGNTRKPPALPSPVTLIPMQIAHRQGRSAQLGACRSSPSLAPPEPVLLALALIVYLGPRGWLVDAFLANFLCLDV